MNRKKCFLLLLTVIMVSSILVSACGSETDEEPSGLVRVLQGVSSATTSSFYPVYATFADIANKNVPNIQVTLLNLGGSVSATNGLMDGTVDIATASSSVIYDAVHGEGNFAENPPYNKFRTLIVTVPFVDVIGVRADSDIYNLDDLDGEKFSAGNPGGSTEANIKKNFEILGITPDYFTGSWDDAVVAIKDRRIEGVVKGIAGRSLDSVWIDIMTGTDIRFVGYTSEQIEQIRASDSRVTFNQIPAGFWQQVPGHDEIAFQSLYAWGPVVRDDFPEDMAYAWTKALFENWSEVVKVHAAFAEADLTLTPQIVEDIGTYMHPGAIRYFREQGISVPDSVIPPEMK